MKKIILFAFALLITSAAMAQLAFDPSIQPNYATKTVILPPSPLKYQVLFIGGTDKVQTTATYGNPAGEVPAKQNHDFIGVTADNDKAGEMWITVNHEMTQANRNIGDGGGMTVFKVRRDPRTDTLIVADQTLLDGRRGKFFNIDFVNTVGETGMNCGGISARDGRIWTAEEWLQNSNRNLFGTNGANFSDTTDFVIGAKASTAFTAMNGKTLKRYQNVNWMVEVDPKQAKAIRKQYNWGRLGFEGGDIAADNKTVYLGIDATPAPWIKFVADVAGDFTKGKLYGFKHDNAVGQRWIELKNTTIEDALSISQQALVARTTSFTRIEWVYVDKVTGKVYMTETGNDNAGRDLGTSNAAPHHVALATAAGTTTNDGAYRDYYGRVLVYDPEKETVEVQIEGGPKFTRDSIGISEYPTKHMSNPDGLSIMYQGKKRYLIICEDLNGNTFGRNPGKLPTPQTICELWLLDLDITNPTINDLIRISATPQGAEVTGAIMTPDGKTMLINSQHPPSSNPFPYNNSLTYAITGWDKLLVSSYEPKFAGNTFQIFPNPVARELNFNEVTDAAIYDMNGQRVRVVRNTNSVDVSNLTPGTYFVQNKNGETQKLIVQ